MPTASVNLKEDQYVRVNQGLNPLTLQAHRDAVRIVFSQVKPAKGNPAFHVLSGSDNVPYPIPIVDTNVWALATSKMSSLIVTEFNGDEDGENPVDTVAELGVLLSQQLSTMIVHQCENIKQLRLLNARVEEAFETGIDEVDV